MRVIFIGDIVGTPGRDFTRDILKQLQSDLKPDLIVANAENVAGGKGLTSHAAEMLYDAGVEILTMGNHTWDKNDILAFIDSDERIVRPANYPVGTPGRGYTVCKVKGRKVLIANVMGRTFLSQLDCPYRAMDRILSENSDIRHVLVDMHAETTSEKLAMGWYFDGRVSAVVGTHTHVPTADERILPKGTAYLTDVGMVGPRDGILGMDRDAVLRKLLSHMPVRFEVATGPRQFCAVQIELDDETGRATAIHRIFVTE